LFDFDNDGVQEICYQDESSLRIVKANKPQIKLDEAVGNTVVFQQSLANSTGFQYPVIADVDNDGSADIIVTGRNSATRLYAFRGTVRAYGASGDKFAPAWPVWNQYMYSPFKIKPDLTVPTPAERITNPLQYQYSRKVTKNNVTDTITYQPFNANIFQTAKFTLIRDEDKDLTFYEPAVFFTSAYICNYRDPDVTKRPAVSGSGTNLTIAITVGNDATSQVSMVRTTPIKIYKGTVSTGNLVRYGTLSNFGATADIVPGQEVRLTIPVTLANAADQEAIYWVRLGDDSSLSGAKPWSFGLNSLHDGTPDSNLGIDVSNFRYRDCDWSDQALPVAKSTVIDDAQTVQEYKTVVIDVLENDILPDNFFPGLVSIADSVIAGPFAGTLSSSGTGRDSRIIYTSTGGENLVNSIDSFTYRFRFVDPVAGYRDRSAKVYIYVLQSNGYGFSACYDENYTVQLKTINTNFYWYDKDRVQLNDGGPSSTRTISSLKVDSVYWIQPKRTINPYLAVDFPQGKLTVSIVNPSGATATMRWTGLISNDWKNPGNWVEVKGTYEAPVAWAPTGCVDVIIPSGAPKYPELIDTATCRNITMKDRAMLTNPHVLKYINAQVEFKLTPSERDRFVMWSAPLQSMYSGDYHFKAGNTPNWGDVFMNYFQQANPAPAGGAAEANHFTATFGKLNDALSLGKAFNLRVAATVSNRDSIFVFPRTETTYTATTGGNPYDTPRPANSKFITHGVTLNNNGQFTLPVAGGNLNAAMIQIVNPYMAYLEVSKFLAANNTKLGVGYYIWDGDVNNGIISVLPAIVNGNRYTITTSLPAATSADLIPPLKSFFAEKTIPSADLSSSLVMSPGWTTTGGTNPYTLRASTPESHILRIKASQGEKTSYAVLYFDPVTFSNYNVKEDVRQVFYDEIPLTVYSLTPQKVALSINTSGDFSTIRTELGLRVRDPGEVRLDFSGMPSFGHNVYLVDKYLQNKEIDLQKTPSYTFTVSKTADSKLMELNDRFSLRSRYTGGFTGSEEAVEIPAWSVSGGHRRIDIQSFTGAISRLHIYDVTGALVYASNIPSDHFSIPVAEGIYIIKAQIAAQQKVEKVFVR
jgi:hypothetical protein